MVIHRAVSGSFERFIAILIEHFAGAFPVWLAPEQVRVLPISDAQTAAAHAVADRLARRRASARTLDDRTRRSTTGSARARCAKVPYMAVVGQREADSDSLALRVRGAGKKQEVMPVGRVPGAGHRGSADAGAGAVTARGDAGRWSRQPA